MNTIHSSSLTHYPVAYSKPQTGLVKDSGVLANQNSNIQNRGADSRPSTPEQIKTALAEAGLSSTIADLPNNTRAQKALNAYIQNNNQIAQRQVTQLFTGIDLFA